jgi:ring-1,2-phenylacetyl-CoA epoxidase subunit PaaE
MMKFYPAKITEVKHVTKDIMTVALELLDGELSDIDYYPGHHVIVRISIDGTEYRRPYALTNTAFLEEGLSLAIKRIKGGRVSNYLHEQAQVGMEIEISAAQGFFYADVNSEDIKAYYLIAQDIGIAPIYSILKSILDAETLSRVFLFYESPDRENILFYRELVLLSEDYPNRLKVIHTLSHPGIFSSLTPWKGQKGKIDKESLNKFLDQYPVVTEKSEFFICGSHEMNENLFHQLIEKGIHKNRIHKEYFFINHRSTSPAIQASQVEIKISGKEQIFIGNKNQNILSSLQKSNLDIPYSCRSGICGTCAAKLVDGKVHMENQKALEAIDVESGWILTCQACPLSNEITVKFD